RVSHAGGGRARGSCASDGGRRAAVAAYVPPRAHRLHHRRSGCGGVAAAHRGRAPPPGVCRGSGSNRQGSPGALAGGDPRLIRAPAVSISDESLDEDEIMKQEASRAITAALAMTVLFGSVALPTAADDAGGRTQVAGWKTWVLTSSAEVRPPPPPADQSSQTQAELAELRQLQ